MPDVAKLFHAGTLARHVRDAEGLRAILEHFFRVPVRIEEFVGHWMRWAPRERTYLGTRRATLGAGAVLGRRVWDRQHKFRVQLGPLTLAQYESFLPAPPGGRRSRHVAQAARGLGAVLSLVSSSTGTLRLHLAKDEVPPLTLGTAGGWAGRHGWRTAPGDRRAAICACDAETLS